MGGKRLWSERVQNMETLGRKEAKGRVPGDLDMEEKPAKETGNQKGSKIRGNQEVAWWKPWQRVSRHKWAAPPNTTEGHAGES